MADRRQLENRLQHLNDKIEEAESRLGAHSVKPILMQQLFELEEARDSILARLKALSEGGGE